MDEFCSEFHVIHRNCGEMHEISMIRWEFAEHKTLHLKILPVILKMGNQSM